MFIYISRTFVVLEIVDEKRPIPTPEQVAGLEESIPQRHSHFALLGLDVIVRAAEHGEYDTSGCSEVRYP